MALPTTIDNINATMYAIDRIKRERCHQQMRTTPGLKYKVDETRRMYPCPSNIKDCQHGRCVITTKELCMEKSQKPFDANGDEIPATSCILGKCPDGKICAANEKCYTPKPYLEFRDGKCVYGNFVLRKWCEFPDHRRKEPVPGVTDVNPFTYDESTGKCLLNKKYCEEDMKVSFKTDELGRPTCYSTTGEKTGEFFLGKTIFRGIEGVLVGENFAGDGIHLYLSGGKLAFDENQVRSAYPKDVYTAAEVAKDRGLKRILFIKNNADWMAVPVVKALSDSLKKY